MSVVLFFLTAKTGPDPAKVAAVDRADRQLKACMYEHEEALRL